MRFTFLGLLIMVGGVLNAEATLSPAQQAYGLGTRLERTGQYEAALHEFQMALTQAPKYFWADRELGNCDYYLGRYSSALTHYDSYLAANPGDVQMKRFVKHLRHSDGSIPNAKARSWAWSLGLDGGAVDMSATDIKRFVSEDAPSTVSGPDSLLGPLVGLQWAGIYHGFLEIFGRLDFASKSATVTQQGASTLTGTLDLDEWSFVLGGRYRWKWDRQSLKLGLALGPAFLTGSYSVWDSQTGAVGALSLVSLGLVIEPSAVYEFRLSRTWGIEGTVGYRSATFSSVEGYLPADYGSFTGVLNPMKFPDGSAVTFNDSGFFGRLGLVLHLGE